MTKSKFLLFFFFLIGMTTTLHASVSLEEILQKEAKRNLEVLSKAEVPAYYISYRVYETTSFNTGSSFGEIFTPYKNKSRLVQAIVRVGSPERDNTHEIKDNNEDNFFQGNSVEIPIEDSEEAISLQLWDYTDATYKKAVQRFQKVISEASTKVASEDKAPDFSKEEREVYFEKPISDKAFDKQASELTDRIRHYSSLFKENKELTSGESAFQINLLRSYFVDTEGACITQNSLDYRINISAETIADDGMQLPLYKSYYANTFKELPDNKTVEKDIQVVSKMLSDLRKAPVADTYAGPALLQPEASGVLFHEFFGHRLEGARMKQENDAQTFKKKIDEKVLADDMSVYFDPTIHYYKNMPLSGSYVFDDEGVRGQKTDIIKNGILKEFLMSRTPIDEHPKSNGHGRGMIYYTPVTRQSNMIIESSNPKTEKELRQILIDDLKKQNKPYGYLFCEVSGGFTNISRVDANAFYVNPLVVYRIYADGSPDELVRGVNLIGTPLSMFSQIEACGDKHGVFNGYCGAESGSIPVSCVAPAVYVKMIETQKQAKSQNLPPILPRP
ncbi:TldD/PmbA family protein [Parabacteroides sp. AM08-6]|uniref:TldD/PmbA family protein n=1 Tax=Parabacteroides sp. AM08-6 TaxID=2292053 RepID=UPI000EFDC396|nr:TldD/PmbA family protein [Parabacteroides sp. AM08-6]RHJ86598.1 TldD/PmbA family protein [Parabacteroides sp. AM08-6]